MSTLHTHLKAHHSVKMIDGVEVIKLPNWMEFWDSLIGCAVRNEKSYKDVSIINNEFMIIMHHAPTLSQFVPVGENGEVLEEPEEYELFLKMADTPLRQSQEWRDRINNYENAQSNVIYEGWGKYHNNTIESGENMISFREDGKIYFSGEDCSRRIYTIDGLNREVQIYLKIKCTQPIPSPFESSGFFI